MTESIIERGTSVVLKQVDDLIQMFGDRTDTTNKSIQSNQITQDESQKPADLKPDFDKEAQILNNINLYDNSGNSHSEKNATDNGKTETEINVFMVQTINKLNCNKIVSAYIRNIFNNIIILPPIILICSSYYCFQIDTLKINAKIDHRNTYGKCCAATVIDQNEHMFKIHYDGYDEKYDIWVDSKNEIHTFTSFQSISNRKAMTFTKIQVGDYIDVNPSFLDHNGWRRGRTVQLENNSGQVEISYSYGGKMNKIWVHSDNNMEIGAEGSANYASDASDMEVSNSDSYDRSSLFGCDSCGSTNQLKCVSVGTFCWSCRYSHWSGDENRREDRRREKRFMKAMYEGWADDL
eukprot:155827_1